VRLEDGARVVTFGNGMVARELIVDCDDAARRLAWSVIGGRMTHHNASAQVVPIDPGGISTTRGAETGSTAPKGRADGALAARRPKWRFLAPLGRRRGAVASPAGAPAPAGDLKSPLSTSFDALPIPASGWLADHRVALTGCDTWSFGPYPPEDPAEPFVVPQTLNTHHGIVVAENLRLEELARDHLAEFLLVISHAKLRGKGENGADLGPRWEKWLESPH